MRTRRRWRSSRAASMCCARAARCTSSAAWATCRPPLRPGWPSPCAYRHAVAAPATARATSHATNNNRIVLRDARNAPRGAAMITKPFGFCSQVEIEMAANSGFVPCNQTYPTAPRRAGPVSRLVGFKSIQNPHNSYGTYLSSTVPASTHSLNIEAYIAYAAGPGGQRAEIRFEMACSWSRGAAG